MNLSGYKMRTTPTHVYFWSGPFSQWFKSDRRFTCSFEAELPVFRPASDGRKDRMVRSGVPLTFSSTEKWMMAAKASLFGDTAPGGTLERILASHDVKGIKAMGREVPGLKGGKWDDGDIAFWNRACMPIVTVGNYCKFSQSDSLFALIASMEGRRFVEGSPYDDIWGVKLGWDDPAIEDESNWKGENRLGRVLDTTSTLLAEFGREADAWKLLARQAVDAPAATRSL